MKPKPFDALNHFTCPGGPSIQFLSSGETCANRKSEVVQRIEGFWFHSGRRWFEGRVRACLGGGEGRAFHLERRPEGGRRAGHGQERQDCGREPEGDVTARARPGEKFCG